MCVLNKQTLVNDNNNDRIACKLISPCWRYLEGMNNPWTYRIMWWWMTLEMNRQIEMEKKFAF